MGASSRGANSEIPPCSVRRAHQSWQTQSGTVAGGQFDWGGRLRNSNGGARKVGSARTVLALIECNGRSQPDGEIDGSSRHESGL